MKNTIKSFAKKIPVVSHSYRLVRNAFRARLPKPSTEAIFTNIYKENLWGGTSSVSGGGSEQDQTGKLTRELSVLIKELEISTMLDIPCGDFNWMSKVNLTGVKYTGADIVKELIRDNVKYQRPDVDFIYANLITDRLPKVDLVFCRDCLVHFSYADIVRALKNVCGSGSTYLLTTTFPERIENLDIETGGWRTLNLEIEPFRFPAPLRILVEGCTENDGMYKDKSMGLWRISEIEKSMPNSLLP